VPRDLKSDRLSLGLGAVMSFSAAVRLLPVSDAEARRWLRARGLVCLLCGREVVRWWDVLQALKAGDDPSEGSAPSSAPLPRVALEPIH
jgi:hypothetical protein